jgi:hypothetical protein
MKRHFLYGFCVSAALCAGAVGCKRAAQTYGGPSTDGAAVSAAVAIHATRSNAPEGEASTQGATSQADDSKATTGESMKLLDQGQPPRRKLRYAWRPTQNEQLSMDLRTAVLTENVAAPQPEVPLPSVHITIAVDPKSVTPDGDLRYAWRVTSATVDASEETPSQVAEGIRVEVADIARMSGSALVTNRGLSKEVTIDSRKPNKLSGTGMAEGVRQTLRDVAAPLPEEAVGLGARWRRLSQLDVQDAIVTQAETFRLGELQGDRGLLEDALAQTAPPQALPAPAGLQGPPARMESMLASGQVTMHFDLSRLVPQTSFDVTTQMVLSGQAMRDAGRNVKSVVHVYYAIAGSRR